MPDNYLEKLQAAKDSKEGWYTIANCFYEMKEAASRDKKQLNHAQITGSSGYSLSTLNRMIAVIKFLNSMSNRCEKLAKFNPNYLSFNSLEVANRIYKLDQKEGLKVLSEILEEPPLSYRKVKDRYNKIIEKSKELVSPHQQAALEAREFKDLALEAIKSCDAILGKGPVSLQIDYHKTNESFFDAVLYKKSSEDEEIPVASFDIKFLKDTPETKRNFEILIYRSFLVSKTHETHWFIIPSALGLKKIMTFCQILDLFGLETIGVASFDLKKQTERKSSLEIYKEPKKEKNNHLYKVIADYNELKRDL